MRTVKVPFYEDSFVKRFFQCVDERCCMEVLVLLGECDGGVTPLMHPDPRPGYDKRSSQCSDDLLSVQGVLTLHPMLNARKAPGQTPVTNAPLL